MRADATRLFHFSEDGAIAAFAPRPLLTPSARPLGREWLNGPLVWAIEEARQALYLFPRDCPRILIWPKARSTREDLAEWWAGEPRGMIAHIEWRWFEAMRRTRLFRYDLPPASFESLDDAGMWVSRAAVTPLAVEVIENLPAALRNLDVELRLVDSLTPLRRVWDSSLHASGIRLRNATDWASA